MKRERYRRWGDVPREWRRALGPMLGFWFTLPILGLLVGLKDDEEVRLFARAVFWFWMAMQVFVSAPAWWRIAVADYRTRKMGS